MVLGNKARGVQYALFRPVARALLRVGATPNAVTILGTAATVIAALTLLPLGHLLAGSLALGVLVLTDSVDGIMARESGRASRFGEFLDSTLDRVSDAAILSGVLVWYVAHTDGTTELTGVAASLACLGFGAIVPYVRAKAEALGIEAAVGLAERADRLLVVLLATFVTGLGAPPAVMSAVLGLLGAVTALTVLQRLLVVHRALRGDHG